MWTDGQYMTVKFTEDAERVRKRKLEVEVWTEWQTWRGETDCDHKLEKRERDRGREEQAKKWEKEKWAEKKRRDTVEKEKKIIPEAVWCHSLFPTVCRLSQWNMKLNYLLYKLQSQRSWEGFRMGEHERDRRGWREGENWRKREWSQKIENGMSKGRVE